MILTIVERVLIKQGTRKFWECSHINWLDMRKSKWDYLYNNGGIIGFVVIKWWFCLLYRQFTCIYPRHHGLCPLNISVRGLPIKTIRFPVIFCVPKIKKTNAKGTRTRFPGLLFRGRRQGRFWFLVLFSQCRKTKKKLKKLPMVAKQ